MNLFLKTEATDQFPILTKQTNKLKLEGEGSQFLGPNPKHKPHGSQPTGKKEGEQSRRSRDANTGSVKKDLDACTPMHRI